MSSKAKAIHTLELALGAMGAGPTSLRTMLATMSRLPNREPCSESDVVRAVREKGRSNPLALTFSRQLLAWDYAAEPEWGEGTGPCTVERRRAVYRRLGAGKALQEACDDIYKPASMGRTTVIRKDVEREWFDPSRKSFYWEEYGRHLQVVEGWPTKSLVQLESSTADIVARVADPYRADAYQSKGLVVGYVQSGKTANFTGVLARAADSGYRLFIVLGGVLDTLREQTQRRIDRELIGQELLALPINGDDYASEEEFKKKAARHGYPLPSEKGFYDWHRFTGPDGDYRKLGKGAGALAFPHHDKSLRLNHPVNLAHAEAKLIVLKKNSARMRALASDLGRLTRAEREGIPTLIIDDESDQASINVRDQNDDERTRVNDALLKLLDLLPRAQYVGYTATPFANVFVNPEDKRDIFPRDFIVSLPRPVGYMGVSDFLDMVPVRGTPTVSNSNEKAFVRSVTGKDDEDPNLQRALDSFLLSGALKLYREAKHGVKPFKHHTMLVHRSPLKFAHERDAEVVRKVYDAAGYGTSRASDRLERLFKDDYLPVCLARGKGHGVPTRFADLKKYIPRCLERIQTDSGALDIRIVNGDNKEEAPDFEAGKGVWAVIVGGAKLSRGYTVEGLTISYYRRTAGASDTLMQMGRWFGFRRGYGDLVRLFVGRQEPLGKKGKKTLDLLEAFKGTCRDEEEFRQELTRYSRETSPRVTPEMVPPLVPFHLLRPTSRNKMRYAKMVQENFGGRWRDPTSAPMESEKARVRNNERVASTLLRAARLEEEKLSCTADGESIAFGAYVGVVQPENMLAFLKGYQWTKKDDGLMARECEFLEKKLGDPKIARWVIIAPQMKGGANSIWDKAGKPLKVKKRARVEDGTRYGVITEPDHKLAAEVISEYRPATAMGPALKRLKRPQTGTMLFYPVCNFDDDESITSMGFSLFFPVNGITAQMKFVVKRGEKSPRG